MKVKQIVEQAQGLLDDQTGQVYQERRLVPYVRQAYEDLILAMQERNLPDIRVNNKEITVNADGSWTDSEITNNASEILKVEERISENYWEPLDEERELPNVETEIRLRYYAFVGGTLKFLGATEDVQARVSYITIPMTIEDEETDIPIKGIMSYMSQETASLTKYSIDKDMRAGALWGARAQRALQTFISDKVKAQQGLGVRRRYPERGLAR